jgi:hypothetical protein
MSRLDWGCTGIVTAVPTLIFGAGTSRRIASEVQDGVSEEEDYS